MVKSFKFFIGIVLLITFFIINAYTMGNKQVIPMKPYSSINIPDGEYLHYAIYTGGEKETDIYYLTKKETNSIGGIIYYLYKDSVSVTNSSKHQKDYKKWPSYTIIDPKQGAVIEANAFFDTNALLDYNNVGGDVFYYHYQLNNEQGYVDYISKTLKKNQVRTMHSRVNVKPGLPVWDRASLFVLSMRFIDFNSGGSMFMVVPDVLKTPIACTYKFISKENISNSAGNFKVNKLSFILTDAFISKLMGYMLKDMYTYIEDSDRRLMIQYHTFGSEYKLEEISNVNVK